MMNLYAVTWWNFARTFSGATLVLAHSEEEALEVFAGELEYRAEQVIQVYGVEFDCDEPIALVDHNYIA